MQRIHTLGLATLARTAGLAALVALGAPATAHAQSAIIYGSLSNVDISNDTSKVCRGVEVEFDGLQVGDYGGSFSSNRYGTPTVAPTPTGVTVTWKSAQTGSAWSERTLQHTVPWFSGQCYQWSDPAIYENRGCKQFGTYFNANLAKVSSRWLCASDTDASVLVPINPQAVRMNPAPLEADYQMIQDEPLTHEAICLDGLCNIPNATAIGAFLAVQMTAASACSRTTRARRRRVTSPGKQTRRL